MKLKHVLWVLTGIVAIVTMAAGIAVLVEHFLRPCDDSDYIECDCAEPEAE